MSLSGAGGWKNDHIELSPALSGAAGKAWVVDVEAVRAALGEDRGAEVADWLVEAPKAHPIWHSYWIPLIHLRPMPDFEDPIIYLDGATHEFWVSALDPRPQFKRQEMIRTGKFHRLEPTNFAAQFIAANDAAAMQRVEAAVQDICDGALSPDTDHIRDWAARFGDNMLKGSRSSRGIG